MRLDKLTTKFQQALADAQSLADGNDQQFGIPESSVRTRPCVWWPMPSAVRAPPGYVGYGDGGHLTGQVQQRNFEQARCERSVLRLLSSRA